MGQQCVYLEVGTKYLLIIQVNFVCQMERREVNGLSNESVFVELECPGKTACCV